MREILKKFTAVFCLALLLCPAVIADTITQDGPGMGQTVVTLMVPDCYTLTIPASGSVTFNAPSTAIGSLVLSDVRLPAGGAYAIGVASANDYSMVSGRGAIAYTLKTEADVYSGGTYTADAEIPLSVSVEESEWVKAPAGDYRDTLTFSVSLVSIAD